MNLTRAFSNECPAPSVTSTNLDKVYDYIQKKSCSLENAKSNYDEKLAISFNLERLSTRCKNSWLVETSKGKIEIPAGLNVLRGPDEQIIFHHEGEVFVGKISPEAFTGVMNCKQKNENPNLDAFKEEAFFHLKIAKLINRDQNIVFKQAIEEVEKKLNQNLTQKKFFLLTQKWQKKTSRYGLDRVALINQYQKIIKNTFDPLESNGRKNSENTLIVPLSVEWFNSDPALKLFFEQAWLKSGYDLRITVGHSGEGVVKYPDKSIDENSSYLQMKELILKTKNFIMSQNQNKRLDESSEAQWLLALDETKFNDLKRMIFLSPDTWTRDANMFQWAEEIPVNQSVGGINSDYLLSVLIHEINVNSDQFLASDTHGPEFDTKALRQCIAKNGIESMAQDPESLQRLFGYNSQLSVIYLKSFLE